MPRAMSDTAQEEPTAALQTIDEPLLAELPTFELFFKTFGFKRVHGRVWGLLVLAGRPLSSREICAQLGISQGAASTTLNELSEWGAVASSFDSSRRCNLHAPVGNALSIVATVFRRREQVVFEQFRSMAQRSLDYVTRNHGERDPRVVTLRSILTTCDIAGAMMQLVFGAVHSAIADPESVLSKAITAAFRVGVSGPAKLLFPKGQQPPRPVEPEPEPEPNPNPDPKSTPAEDPTREQHHA